MKENPKPETGPPIVMRGIAAGSMQDPNATLLADVNWQVNTGDFWVLAGLQGSGKSDFMMLTAGLMMPLRGNYWLYGEPMPILDEARLPARLRLGLVFENGQLFNHLTVSENIALPLRYHHNMDRAETAAVVQAMLEHMDLGPWAESTPGALGRNWHRRVGLARALMLKPQLLLLDNPLGGLDLRHLYWWLDMLQRLSRGADFLQQQPITLVTTAADLRPWTTLARQFAIIKDAHMTVLGERAQLESADPKLVGELLARAPRD